jgi:hypothetical protein
VCSSRCRCGRGSPTPRLAHRRACHWWSPRLARPGWRHTGRSCAHATTTQPARRPTESAAPPGRAPRARQFRHRHPRRPAAGAGRSTRPDVGSAFAALDSRGIDAHIVRVAAPGHGGGAGRWTGSPPSLGACLLVAGSLRGSPYARNRGGLTKNSQRRDGRATSSPATRPAAAGLSQWPPHVPTCHGVGSPWSWRSDRFLGGRLLGELLLFVVLRGAVC